MCCDDARKELPRHSWFDPYYTAQPAVLQGCIRWRRAATRLAIGALDIPPILRGPRPTT